MVSVQTGDMFLIIKCWPNFDLYCAYDHFIQFCINTKFLRFIIIYFLLL
jgi:hypothetical protein